MKILKSTVISPFGGLNYVLKELDDHRVGELLNTELPALAPQCQYDWRELFYSF